ncbi:MAG: TolC family protein [Chitinispirillaceae bacterium]
MNNRKFLMAASVVFAVIFYSPAQDEVLTLDQCIEKALESNLQLQIAREKVAENEAAVKEATAGFLPKVSASANYSRLGEAPTMEIMGQSITAGNVDNYKASLSLTQPLYAGGQIRIGRRMASYGLSASEWQRETTRKDVVRDVTKAYYGVLAARRSLVVLDSSVASMEVMVRDLKNAVEVDMRGEHELLQAEVQLLNQKLSRQQAASGADLAADRLSTLIGRFMDEPLQLNDEIPPLDTFDLPELAILQKRARKESPEIKALEEQLFAARASERMAMASYLPSVMASAGLSGQTQGVDELEWQNSSNVSLVLQWDLFDGGAAYHKRSRARSQTTQLELTIQDMRTSLELVVKNNYTSLKDAFESLELNRKSIEQARRSYEITYDKFQQGLVPNSEVLNAQNSRLQAEINYYRALSDYYSKRAELEYLISIEK